MLETLAGIDRRDSDEILALGSQQEDCDPNSRTWIFRVLKVLWHTVFRTINNGSIRDSWTTPDRAGTGINAVAIIQRVSRLCSAFSIILVYSKTKATTRDSP